MQSFVCEVRNKNRSEVIMVSYMYLQLLYHLLLHMPTICCTVAFWTKIQIFCSVGLMVLSISSK